MPSCNIIKAKEKMLSELYPSNKAKIKASPDDTIVKWTGYIDALEDCLHYHPELKIMRTILIKKMKELGWEQPK